MAVFVADLKPKDPLALGSFLVDLLHAADLQWDRMHAALDEDTAAQRSEWPGQFLVEVYFLLVAARDAAEFGKVFRTVLEDGDELTPIVSKLYDNGVKEIRDHFAHLVERMPGQKKQEKARAISNFFIGTLSTDRRYLTFGKVRYDLVAIHDNILQVAGELEGWLAARSRLGRAAGP